MELTPTEIVEAQETRLKSELIILESELPEMVAAKLQEKYGALTIQGIDDKKGLAAVDEARKHCKRLRLAVEKRRKELKDWHLKAGKSIDEKAKELVSRIEPFERDLEQKQDAIEAEIKRIEAEKREAERQRMAAEEALRQRTKARVDYLFSLGLAYNGTTYFLPGSNISVLPFHVETAENGFWDELIIPIDEYIAKQRAFEYERQVEASKAAQVSDIDALLDTPTTVIQPEPNYWGTPAPAVQQETLQYQEVVQQVQHEQPIIREMDTFDYTQVQQAPPVQPTLPPQGNWDAPQVTPAPSRIGSIHEGGLNPAFLAGFRIAKQAVLDRLNDPTPITRQDLINYVNSLQPNQ